MLTGDPPFTASTAQPIVAKVMTEKPTAPRRVRERVPVQVEQAVLTALEKLPADRFASAAEFGAALVGGGSAIPAGMQRGGGLAGWAHGTRGTGSRSDRVLLAAMSAV